MNENEAEIRKKIAEEIRAEIPEMGPHRSGKVYYGALMYAVQIILKGTEK